MSEQEAPKVKQPPILFNQTQTLIGEITTLLGGAANCILE